MLKVGGFALVGNELRLALHRFRHRAGAGDVVGALTVGLLASLMRHGLHEPRISLTVSSIIMVVPGTFAFQTVVLFNQGDALAALRAAVLGDLVASAMALGLAAARFITERRWLVES